MWGKKKPLPAYLRPQPFTVDTSDPRGMGGLILRYLEWMQIQNYSKETVAGRRVRLRQFAEWCDERSITMPGEVTKPILERYKRYLFYFRQKNGKPLSYHAMVSRLVPVRMFFKWLTKNNFILYNPASELELPRSVKRLPKHVLTEKEAEEVLAQPDVRTSVGLRDRAILETLYSTGIRRGELSNLRLYDLDTDRGTVMIREAKGKKDRIIPIGDRAIAWIEKYLKEVRAMLAPDPDDGILFLSRTGDHIHPDHLTALAHRYVDAAEIGKSGACHLFRHTMATVMLENGADVRFIQQMLGHSQMSTTEVYTHVSVRQLKQIHTATHPAKLDREKVKRLDIAESDNLASAKRKASISKTI